MLVQLNDKILDSTDPQEELLNRSFLYGDALFETIIVRNGTIFFLEDHFQRMLDGMAALKMTAPENFAMAFIEARIHQLIILNKLVDQEAVRVRIQIVRKPGGLYTPTQQDTDLYIIVQPYQPPVSFIKDKVFIANTVQLHYSSFSSHKTCNSLPYVLAGIEREQRGVDDLILRDQEGHLAECCSSNLFWIKKSVLYTPSLQAGCIAGIMRKQVILHALMNGLAVQEGLFRIEDLADAAYVFTTNVTGIFPIVRVENYLFNTLLPLDLENFYLHLK